MEVLQLDFDTVSLEAHRYSPSGRLVCMLPGLGGGIRRFADLGLRLANAGFQPVALNPRRALFAPGNDIDPAFIDPGRSSDAAQAQMAATRAEPAEAWLGGGSAPMLVVQGEEDRIAPPENGHRLQARWPDRVEVVDVPNAGHAILNEQPEAAAAAIIDFISRRG